MSELATRPNAAASLKQFLDLRADNLAKWVRGKIDPASLIRFAVLEYSQSEQLQRCTQDSIYLALIACAQVGLEPSGVKGEAYIVPFKTTATFMPGYRGLIKLALRSGAVTSLVSHVVYEADHFEIDLGTDGRVVHRPALSNRGRMIGAYALAKMSNGEFDVEWMPLEDLERVRKSAERGGRESPAYANWADQMARKAPIRRICKRLPMGDEYALAARLDEAAETGDMAAYQRALDVEPVVVTTPAQVATVDRIKNRIKNRTPFPIDTPLDLPAVVDEKDAMPDWTLTPPEAQS